MVTASLVHVSGQAQIVRGEDEDVGDAQKRCVNTLIDPKSDGHAVIGRSFNDADIAERHAHLGRSAKIGNEEKWRRSAPGAAQSWSFSGKDDVSGGIGTASAGLV